jgi:hypothetical protein
VSPPGLRLTSNVKEETEAVPDNSGLSFLQAQKPTAPKRRAVERTLLNVIFNRIQS